MRHPRRATCAVHEAEDQRQLRSGGKERAETAAKRPHQSGSGCDDPPGGLCAGVVGGVARSQTRMLATDG